MSQVDKSALEVLTWTIPPESETALAAWLSDAGFDPILWQSLEPPRVELSLYLELPDRVATALTVVRQALTALGLPEAPLQRGRLSPSDWTEGWKRFFKARRVSARLVVRPPWEPWTEQEGDIVVTIDPGMSFGTGQHETTRDCLVYLDQLAGVGAGGVMFDLGCGSGILSIAAARLGFAPVCGFDNDPVAVETARTQAELNGVSAHVAFKTADLAKVAQSGRTASVVAANILAPVLIDQAEAVSACVAPDGWLLLAGILVAQYPEVRATYQRLGFRETDSRIGEVWQSGCFQRGRSVCLPADAPAGNAKGRLT